MSYQLIEEEIAQLSKLKANIPNISISLSWQIFQWNYITSIMNSLIEAFNLLLEITHSLLKLTFLLTGVGIDKGRQAIGSALSKLWLSLVSLSSASTDFFAVFLPYPIASSLTYLLFSGIAMAILYLLLPQMKLTAAAVTVGMWTAAGFFSSPERTKNSKLQKDLILELNDLKIVVSNIAAERRQFTQAIKELAALVDQISLRSSSQFFPEKSSVTLMYLRNNKENELVLGEKTSPHSSAEFFLEKSSISRKNLREQIENQELGNQLTQLLDSYPKYESEETNRQYLEKLRLDLIEHHEHVKILAGHFFDRIAIPLQNHIKKLKETCPTCTSGP